MKKIEGNTLLRIAAASFCVAAAAINLISFAGGKHASDISVEHMQPQEITVPIERTVEEIEVQNTPDAKEKDGRIDLNTASAEELETLKGIGPTKASAIIEYRERYGGFTCIEEITEVKGIGEKTFEKIKDRIYVSGP